MRFWFAVIVKWIDASEFAVIVKWIDPSESSGDDESEYISLTIWICED